MTSKDSEILSFKPNVIGLCIMKGIPLSEAEDLYHDLYIRIHDNIKGGKYKEQGKFKSWVMLMARNLIIDYYREKARYWKNYVRESLYRGSEYLFDIWDIVADPSINAEEEMIQEEVFERVRKVYESLRPEQREVVNMRFREGKTFKEISKETDVSIMTSIGRMRYAIKGAKKRYYGEEIN